MKLFLLVLGLVGSAAMVTETVHDADEVIPGEYIVVLKPHLEESLRLMHMQKLTFNFNNSQVKKEFNINKGQFLAYAVKHMSAEEAAVLATLPEVSYVEPNYVYHIDVQPPHECRTQESPGNWGLTRTVNGGALPSPNRFEYDAEACGEDVDIHILDTGIQITHQDFNGRAIAGTDHGLGVRDGHGHGTHVASTAAGEAFGIARCATLIGEKVCTDGGSCPADAQFSGLAAVAAAAARWLETGKRIVANMSLGGAFRQSSNDAVNAAHAAGAIIAVSAGNSNNNACTISPASAERAYTVMSSTNTDARSSFSSHGPCSQIFAPGSNIMAAWIGSDTATRSVSGTSMASPHVAGAMAAKWSNNLQRDNDAVENMMTARSNRDRITSPGTGSPNKLLYLPCERN